MLDFTFFPNIMTQILPSTLTFISLIYYYLTYLESQDPELDVKFNPMDIVHFLTFVFIRIFVISTKYGFYSIEHKKLVKTIKIDSNLNTFDLIMTTATGRKIEHLEERLSLIADFLRINKDSFYFMIEEEQLKCNDLQRLRDKNDMAQFYSDPKNDKPVYLKWENL